MDNIHTNRLDFTKMVYKQIGGYPQMKSVKPIFKHPERRTKKEEETFINRTNIQRNIDNIFAHVHAQLKERNPSQYSKLSMHVVANMEEGMPGNFTSSYTPEKSYTKSADDHPKSLIFENPVHKGITIPRLKVLCHRKEQRRLHCTIPPPRDENNFVNQKRMAEVQQQNAIITSMLEDQKQLQRERCSIALEISSMRNHLDAIRGRLDSSLKKLEQNKTYNESDTSSSALKS